MLGEILKLIGPFAGVIIGVFLLVVIFKVCYKKCPPNKAMVITGPKGVKSVIGKACFVIPFFYRVDYMSLENIQVDFTSKDEIPTKDAINVLVDAVANMSISKDPKILETASSKFLGYKIEDIQRMVQPILEGNIREIISQTTLKELIQGDKKVFAERVVENVTPNLKDMGLELTTFNIQNFKDNKGIIDNLGIENTELIRKDAAKAKAAAESEIAIAKARADKEANDARIAADTEIAEKNNQLEIRKAELKKEADIKKAEADAAYKIQEEEQRKSIEISTAEANLAKQEKEIELKAREVEIQEKALEANIKKKAEAEKYRREQEAEAELFERQKKAEAELIEKQREAEAKKLQAEAEKYSRQQEAEGIAAVGKAEAEAIAAKGQAEAEALDKKAEAMKKYGQAAMMEMIVQALPEMAKAIAEPLSTIDKVSIIESGDGKGGVSSMGNYVPQVLAKTIESVKETTGLDITEIMKANTYDAKVNRNINISGLDGNNEDKDTIVSAIVDKSLKDDEE